jgi:GT2 family glycosyltransferase
LNFSVSTIVLNWNGYEDTIECVASLQKLAYPELSITIIDNGSTDGSEVILKERFPDIPVIQTGRNLGYAGGVNAGLRHALKTDAEYFLILNNDTVVDPRAVDELINVARSDGRIGMLSSKIYFHDRPDTLWYAGATYNPWLGWGRHRGYNEVDVGQYDTVEETERPSGCAMMVSREFCDRVGLLDEKFFSYGEEVDWSLRGKKAGYKVMYVPGSKVWHKVSSSTGGTKTCLYLYYSVRNTLMCVDKNAPLPWGIRHLRYSVVTLIFVLSLFTMKVPKKRGVARIYQGVRDYFRGHMGAFVDFAEHMETVNRET